MAYHALRVEHDEPFGGDFVDVGLKVLMRASSDTLFAFRANNLHGTTPMQDVEQLGVVFPFSERIAAAYRKAIDAPTIFLEEAVIAPPGATVVSQHI